MVKKPFGLLPNGEQAFLYTISSGRLEAQISDFGATLVRLYVPDSKGELADVVLGFDDANDYMGSTTYFGATARVWVLVMPKLRAASVWPPSMDWMPLRMISHR